MRIKSLRFAPEKNIGDWLLWVQLFMCVSLNVLTLQNKGKVFHKVQVRSTRNSRACMIRCMDVDEAKRICKNRSR